MGNIVFARTRGNDSYKFTRKRGLSRADYAADILFYV